MRNVEIDIGIANQTIIADHRHVLLMRSFDDCRGDLSVMRRNDQDIDTFGEKALGLIYLGGVAAIGDQYLTLRADFLAALFDQRLVALPAFLFQSVHRKSDAHRPTGFRATAARVRFRTLHASAKNQYRRNKNNKFH
jgi:hypothetical protein